MDLMAGLRAALDELRQAGCQRVYIDGSFVTDKEAPGDYDGCWDITGVDITRLAPIFIDRYDLQNGRRGQKRKYLGELLPVSETALENLRFFQLDRNNNPKGIVALDLGDWK